MAFLIVMCVALIFISIGIVQYRQKDIPVTFYSGESPLDPNYVKDVKAFNQKHGRMWIVFGLSIGISEGILFLLSKPELIFLVVIVLIGGIVGMFFYHSHLMRVYVIKDVRLSSPVTLSKPVMIMIAVSTLGILAFVGVMMFAGSVDVTFDKDHMILKAMSTKSLTVEYDDIESIKYETGVNLGRRDFGIGSITLSAGDFSNEEFGNYKLYSYNACDDLIVLYTSDGIVAFNGKDEQITRSYYDRLKNMEGK